MDLGADKQQIEKLRRMWERWASDPVQLRFVVTILLALVGIGAVERPLSGALAAARVRNAEAETTSRLATELCQLSEQVASYDKRAAIDADLVSWQNYVLEKLRCTSATLISLEPHKTVAKGPFQVLEMELVAKGRVFPEFADFIDRLEHGERLVRLDKLRFERTQTSIYMTAIIRGLVKPVPRGKNAKASGGTSPAAPAAAPAADGGRPEAAPPPATAARNAGADDAPGDAADGGSAADGDDATSTDAAGQAPRDGGSDA